MDAVEIPSLRLLVLEVETGNRLIGKTMVPLTVAKPPLP